MRKKSDMLKEQFYINNRFNFFLTILSGTGQVVLNLALAFILNSFLNLASESNDVRELYQMMWIGIGFLVLSVSVGLLSRYAKNRYICTALLNYKNYSFHKNLDKKIDTFNETPTSKYISGLTNDIESIENNYLLGNINFIIQFLYLIGGLGCMFYLSWFLAICILVTCVIPIVISVVCGGKLTKLEKLRSSHNEVFVGMVKDILIGFPVVKSFKAEGEVQHIFEDTNSTLEDIKKRRRETVDFIGIMSSSGIIIVNTVLFAVGAYLCIKEYVKVGIVMAFLQLLNYVLGPIQQLGPLNANRKAAYALIQKMEESNKQEDAQTACLELCEFKERIMFQNVNFAYEENSPILKNVNCCFEKGKSYAIVGASGSGKSTMLNLLLGYHNDYVGKITIDGNELKEISTDSLYDLISIIQQSVFIFDSTIEDNITMYKKFATERIEEAITKSGLNELIREKGANYKSGENGCNLSGGEKQRISIARCLVRNLPVLLMDEATAALDNQTSYMVENAILNIDDLTRIIVTHKLNKELLRKYDQIFVLSQGTIKEVGTFDELIEQKGYFSSLYQASNE